MTTQELQQGSVFYKAELWKGAIRYLKHTVTRVTPKLAWFRPDAKWSDGSNHWSTYQERKDRRWVEAMPTTESGAAMELRKRAAELIEDYAESAEQMQRRLERGRDDLATIDRLIAATPPTRTP